MQSQRGLFRALFAIASKEIFNGESHSNTEVDFEVIVIGAGIAGCVTAYLLAKKGHSVLLAERGPTAGSKNLSGGILYCRVMEEVFPDFIKEAPIERIITRNFLSFLSAESFVNIDYGDRRLNASITAVSVLRAKLDEWLAGKCEEAGVTLMPGIKVDALVKTGNEITGIRAGEDEPSSHVVVAADGVNSFICRDAGIRGKEPEKNLAVGIKSVIGLPKETIEERFHLVGSEGVAFAVVGGCTNGLGGEAFFTPIWNPFPLALLFALTSLRQAMKAPLICMTDFYPIQKFYPLSRAGNCSNTVAI